MGIGRTGTLYYVDENGEAIAVSADNPLPESVNGEYPTIFVSDVVEK